MRYGETGSIFYSEIETRPQRWALALLDDLGARPLRVVLRAHGEKLETVKGVVTV